MCLKVKGLLIRCLLPLLCSLSQTDATAFATAHGWTADGNSFVLPAVVENLPRAKKVEGEGIKYSEIAGVVATLAK